MQIGTSKFVQAQIFLALLFLPAFAFAQIQGAIRDSLNQPLPFANVMLLNQNDSSLVSGMIAS